jgi:hypothetical protein
MTNIFPPFLMHLKYFICFSSAFIFITKPNSGNFFFSPSLPLNKNLLAYAEFISGKIGNLGYIS